MYRWCRKLRSTTGYKRRSLPGSELLNPSWNRFPETVKHPVFGCPENVAGLSEDDARGGGGGEGKMFIFNPSCATFS
jgi:hypothetical protein